MSCIARRWWKNCTELPLGWNLLNIHLKNLNFLANLFPTVPSRGGGAYRRPRLKQQKTQTEITEDPNWNNSRLYLKQHFTFLHFDQLSSLGLLGQSSEVECNPKMSISLFDDLGPLLSHFGWLSLLGLLGRSSEVERNWKMNILSFQWLRGPFFTFQSNFVAPIAWMIIRILT